MLSKAKSFSHIYVEEGALEHPRAQAILQRFPSSEVVVVDDYQNVFGRGRQDFWRQKASPKLILALKKDNFLYGGNEFLQANMSPNFSYNALVLNCPYDCHYCYLQGMYGGANVVAFVNLEEYFAAAEAGCARRPDPGEVMPLAISYDTDLLALEGILGYTSEWVEWARSRPDMLLEVRTKSAPGRFLRDTPPTPSARLAWTLSPDEVAQRYETGAPSLKVRLKSLREAAELGWRIALCIDPILKLPDGDRLYRDFITLLEKEVPWSSVERVELGVFRVSSAYFKRMLDRPGTDLLQYPYEHANKTVSYNKKEREQLVDTVKTALLPIISKKKIFIWT
jgi:spore photoproduct lyase